MRILITGNLGYVGSVLTGELRRRLPDAHLIGLDAGFFADRLTSPGPIPEIALDVQRYRDLRDVDADDLAGMDAVIHLAALSNDPIGARFDHLTDAINRAATERLAALAAQAGVRSFVFASSCAVYGAGDDRPRREDDPVDPLTAYARSKVASEQLLAPLARDGMVVTALRFATACGVSPRLRLDLVVNDLVATALRTGVVEVRSDGTPWRPLIDVSDMARACVWGLTRTAENGGGFLAVNVGRDGSNHRVLDIAEHVADAVPGASVTVDPAAGPDRRSYQVDFARFQALAPDHQPLVDLSTCIGALVTQLTAEPGSPELGGGRLLRLTDLEARLTEGSLDEQLRWRARHHPTLTTPP